MFVTQSDDGVRLWLGNQLVIDNLTPHPLTEDRGTAVALTGGQSYNLRLEYFELTANAVIRLMWIRPGQTAPEIIPSANLATPVTPNPAPTLTSLSPSLIPLTTQTPTLTVNGSNFLQGVIVQFNNSARTTNFVSSTQVTTTLTSGDLAFATQFKITAVNPLPGGGTSNPLTLTISGGFEADVAPRPNGSNNGTITIADWTQLGRFASGLDVVTAGNEYQRADCAPRATLGDGRITLTDWVQAGRYAAALDSPTGAGGPVAPAMNLEQSSEPGVGNRELGLGSWELGVRNQEFGVGFLPIVAHRPTATNDQTTIYAKALSPNSVGIFCEASGIENAVGFSFRFDAERWEFLSSSNDSIPNTLSYVNASQISTGFVGLVLALPPSHHFETGNRQIAVLTFRNRLGNIPPSYQPVKIEFADQPIVREIINDKAESLRANFAPSLQPPVNARLAVTQPRRR